VQVWTVAIDTWPGSSSIGKSVSFYKINR